jgi:gliding motility-associated-like protein
MKSLKQILFVLLFTFSGFLALSQTVINSFSPTNGDVGSSITISGSGFDATTSNNVVYFGGAQATVISASTSSLSVTVPKGSTYDPITVINITTGKVSQSGLKFTTTNSSIANYTVDANSFSTPVNLATVAGAGAWYEIGDMITVGDFDLDGKTDIAKASSSSSIGVLMNTIASGGTITSSSFSSAGTFAVGSGAYEIASGDIDGDGKLDLVSIGLNNFSILRNTSSVGSISFATKVDISSSYQYRIKLADVDGDGKIDVLTGSNYGSNFNVYLNTSSVGSISFNPTPVVISGGGLGGSRHFTVGDVNMDGKMDVVCASENSFDAKLFINTSSIGSVSFASPVAVSNGYWYNAIGDFNNDGKNDIIALGSSSSSLSINNYTSGSFTAASLTTNASVGGSDGLSYVAPTDFNGDGKLDFVTSFQNSGQYVTWSKSNYTSGSFSGSSFSSFSKYGFNTPYQIILCDFNGDNKQDILTSASANSFVQIAQNNMAALPTVNATANLTSFSTCAGTASTPQTITISGTNLTGNLTLSAVTGYEYSFDNITYNPTFTVIPANNTVPNINVYVRLSSTAAAGTQTGVITVASAGATSVTINLSGTVNAVPTVAAITGPSDVCKNSTITLASTTTGGVWSSSNTNIATVSAGVVTGVNTGTATISYTVTNSGCSTTQTKAISVNGNPSASIAKTDVTCYGLTNGSATVTVSGGTAPYTYVWGGSTSTTNTASNLAAGKVKCTITDAKGCKFPNIDSTVISTGNVNQPVASNGSYTYNFTDPIPSGFGLTVSGVKINAIIYFPFNGGYYAGNGWTISGTNVGGSAVGGSGAMDYPVTIDYNGPIPGYVYGGSNSMIFGNAWNSVTFKSATITLRHELAAVINQPAQVQLTSATSIAAICNNGTVNYTPTVSPVGATYSWIRPSIAGISNASATGSGPISETLTNTTNNPITVPYTFTVLNAGCVVNQIVSVVVNPTPVLTSTLTPSAVASNTVFSYSAAGSTGATFSWSRAAVTGISNLAATGTGNISETLVNTTTAPITVSYVYTISIGSCTNTQTVNVVINPTPVFASSLTPPAVCSGSAFTYTPSSATTGTTYSWSRATVAGISNAAATGTGSVNETLTNTTANPVNVTYVYTLTANGATNTQNVVITVNPSPSISSSLTPSSICNNATFTYTPTSATSGATFSWTRATVSGIGNTAASGTGSISEVLTNTTANTLNVVYAITSSANGCNGTPQNVTVPVNPSPTLSTSLNVTASSGVLFNYVPNSATTNITAAGWSRAVVAGISNAAASSASGIINETLINTTAAPIVVSYVYTLAIGSCTNTQTVNVTVNPRPTLTSPLTATTTSNSLFTYTPTSATTGTSFSWSRAVVAGISNAAATGTGSINETLINTTANSINVTYVLTLTANGVTNTQNVVVTVYPIPTLSSSLTPSAVCSNAPFTYTPTSATTGTTYSWSRSSVTGISNTAATGTGVITETLVNTILTPVTVNYIVTLTANGVTNTQTVSVVVNPMPTLTSGLTVNALCNVSPLFYIASSGTPGTTFAWSRASIIGIANAAATGTGNIIETLNNTTAAPITVNYVYTSTANGCSNPQTVSVVINPTPTLSSTQTAAPVCNNTLFAYTATSATTGTTFAWSRAAVTGISNAAASGLGASISETLINTTAAPITVTYVFTLTANNCTNTQTVSVVVNPTALLSSTLTPAGICTNTVFAYTPSSATNGTTYAWSRAAVAGISNAAATGTGAISETLINTTVNPITVNYVYTLTANACTNTTTQTVAVIVKPTPVLTSTLTPAAQCNAQSFNYMATSATAGTTYTWSRAAVTGITPATGSGTSGFILENLVNITANPLTVNYVINLNANGCTNTQNFSLTINSTPVLSSTLNAAPICNNTAFTYTPSSNTTGTTYAWSRAAVAGISNAAATGIGAINETLVNTTQTPLVVTYVVVLTANGCSNTQTVTVTVNPTPQLTSLSTTATCNNSSFTYTPTSATAGTTYAWSRAAVTGISNAAASGTGVINETLLNTTTSPVVTTYTITLTANTCTNTQTVNVTVNPTPQLSSSLVTTPICSNTNFAYTPTSAITGTTFAWTRASVAGISNAAGTGFGSINEALVNTTANPITVNYVYVLSANNCTNIQNFNVIVNPSPVLTSTLSPAGVCSNMAFAYAPTSATTGTTITWSRSAIAGISNVAATGTGSINETLINTGSATASPKYLVTLTANGCSNSQFVQATIYPTPTLSSGLTIAPACSGVETNYTAASATAGTTFAWSRAAVANISNAAATGTGNIKETLTNTGTTPATVNYVYTLTANTCTNTQTVATTINPKPATPIITALGPTTFCVEESVDLQVATVSGATYNWYLNGSNLGVNAATATVNIEGAYTASITNTFGCTSATSNAVAITTPCTSGISGMPTVFTPNGDGENDELFAVIPGIKELNKFSIYNRWGNMVFDTKVIGTAWDGKFKDVDQPADVYFWYVEGIDGNGNIYKKQGKVVLAR